MDERWNGLIAHLAELAGDDRLVVGLSGGVDSTLLAKAAHQAVGERMLAVVARTPLLSRETLERADSLCRELSVPHETISIDLLADPAIRNNRNDRCYRCKLLLFGAIQKAFPGVVLDGSNGSDNPARPGFRALGELSVHSPLRRLGISKDQVRQLARIQGLPNADLASDSCLATRFDTGKRLSAAGLEAVETIETRLHELGLQDVRARAGDLKVIVEVPRGCEKILEQNHLAIVETIKGAGLQIAGYCFRPEGRE